MILRALLPIIKIKLYLGHIAYFSIVLNLAAPMASFNVFQYIGGVRKVGHLGLFIRARKY